MGEFFPSLQQVEGDNPELAESLVPLSMLAVAGTPLGKPQIELGACHGLRPED